MHGMHDRKISKPLRTWEWPLLSEGNLQFTSRSLPCT